VGDFALLTLLRICGEDFSASTRIPHIIPIHVQYLLGQATWTAKMFEELPRLDHRNPQHIPQTLTHYLMVILVTNSGLPIP
jgi:hypothetical protein